MKITEILDHRNIEGYLPNLGTDGILILRWSNDPKWVEIRGENYWKGYNPEDALHKILDAILPAHTAWLFAGQVVNFPPHRSDYEFVKSLLEEL